MRPYPGYCLLNIYRFSLFDQLIHLFGFAQSYRLFQMRIQTMETPFPQNCTALVRSHTHGTLKHDGNNMIFIHSLGQRGHAWIVHQNTAINVSLIHRKIGRAALVRKATSTINSAPSESFPGKLWKNLGFQERMPSLLEARSPIPLTYLRTGTNSINDVGKIFRARLLIRAIILP